MARRISFLDDLRSLVLRMGGPGRASAPEAAAVQDADRAIRSMSWDEFEALVAAAFRRRGFVVTEADTTGPGGDVDLVLRRGHEIVLLQCRHWRDLQVGVRVVRDLYGSMIARGALEGVVLTSGHFSREAWEFARGKPIRLLRGSELRQLIVQGRTFIEHGKPATPEPEAPKPPACPRCGSATVRRKARVGGESGAGYWGCSRFPECRGIAP